MPAENKKKRRFPRRIKNIPGILITAGPTVEAIDPIRFISNRSTGYMGYELARVARVRGHKVTLISGPTKIKPPGGVRFLNADTARQMHEAVHRELRKSWVLLMASAVSDFKPAYPAKHKIKSRKTITLSLVRNPDILQSISKKERKGKVIVGFSLESSNLIRNSAEKLKKKKLDLIVANAINKSSGPFGKGVKTVYLLDNSGGLKKIEKKTKTAIAGAILDRVIELCYTSVSRRPAI